VSTRTAAAPPRRPKARRRPSRAAVLRRRLLLGGGGLLLAALAVFALAPYFDKAVQEVVLPLKHEDVIRQQAADKDLDPSLIAAVIYTESRFRDQTSHAGAKGLMQILPATADYIAQKSGGTAFEQGDLADPQINISYGSWYLRYLLDKYGGNEVLAIAAYNAGEGKVDEWVSGALSSGDRFRVEAIPFEETRHYVGRVLTARDDYRREYRRELGL
jgi:soluble lytic murein transglycosylase